MPYALRATVPRPFYAGARPGVGVRWVADRDKAVGYAQMGLDDVLVQAGMSRLDAGTCAALIDEGWPVRWISEPWEENGAPRRFLMVRRPYLATDSRPKQCASYQAMRVSVWLRTWTDLPADAYAFDDPTDAPNALPPTMRKALSALGVDLVAVDLAQELLRAGG